MSYTYVGTFITVFFFTRILLVLVERKFRSTLTSSDCNYHNGVVSVYYFISKSQLLVRFISCRPFEQPRHRIIRIAFSSLIFPLAESKFTYDIFASFFLITYVMDQWCIVTYKFDRSVEAQVTRIILSYHIVRNRCSSQKLPSKLVFIALRAECTFSCDESFLQALLSISLESLVLPLNLPVSRHSNASHRIMPLHQLQAGLLLSSNDRSQATTNNYVPIFLSAILYVLLLLPGPIFLGVPRENVLTWTVEQFRVLQLRYYTRH